MAASVIATTNSVALENKPLWKNREFIQYLVGVSLSGVGDQFYLVALPWVILQLTGSASIMGSIMMVAAIPRSVLMLLGGAVSDRISARIVMIYTAIARALFVTAIGALLYRNALTLLEIYALSFAFGLADAFSFPASDKYMPSLVSGERLVPATSAQQTTSRFILITGPAPAALAMKALGIPWAFFIDAISFLFIPAALWTLPDTPVVKAAHKKSHLWALILEGLRYVRKDVPLLMLIMMAGVMNFFFFGPLLVGLPYLAKTKFGSPTAFGIWVSAFAAGSLAGNLLAGIVKVKKRGIMMVAGGAFVGICLCAVGLLASVPMIAAGTLLMGATSGFVDIQLFAWFQQRIDRDARGRVNSVILLVTIGLLPVSLALSGVLAAWNLTMTFILGGFGTFASALATALNRPIREIE